MNLEKRFKIEAQSFNSIVKERARYRQIPDLKAEFNNIYFYNNIWRDSQFLRQEYGPICEWLIGCLTGVNESSVIELGSGNGWLSLELARAGFNTVGLDISHESIKIAQEYARSRRKEKINLRYICKNIIDYKDYHGESVVCFGFLHHLPSPVLKQVMHYLTAKMKRKSLLLAVEPRYDHASKYMAAMIYAFRLALPNHFKYSQDSIKNSYKHITDIFHELSELARTQSEMDNESSSDLIVKTIKDNFDKVELRYSTSFFDKLIGSSRISKQDLKILSTILKQLDNLIVKYNYDLSRTVMIKAWNK